MTKAIPIIVMVPGR